MPIYEYRCENGHLFEVMQKITEDPVTTCETCGARTALEGRATSDRCPFCGSARVLDAGAHRNQVRPESLVPLEVGRDMVEAAFQKWIRSRWFRPPAT